MKANIAHSEKKRVVIAGGGLGGLELAFRLLDSEYQVVLVDRNNYHQFPPLIYQVASAGLEPSSISFPFRRLFQGKKDFFFRMANVERVIPEENALKTSVGTIHYDYLVFAAGATTNFFGNENIEKNTLPMKTVAEGMRLRNTILEHLELAETEEDEAKRQALLNIVIVGGGASGVEIAGGYGRNEEERHSARLSGFGFFKDEYLSRECRRQAAEGDGPEVFRPCRRRPEGYGREHYRKQVCRGFSGRRIDTEGWHENSKQNRYLGEWHSCKYV